MHITLNINGRRHNVSSKNKYEHIDEEIKGYTQEEQPGTEHTMDPFPIYNADYYKGNGKLKDKVAIITGGNSVRRT